MKAKSALIKATSVFFAILFTLLASPISVFADEADAPSADEVNHALVLSSDSISVGIDKTVKITATVTNVDKQPSIVWRSLNMDIATVDSNGNVTGVSQGRATITATAIVNNQKINGEFVINVIKDSNFLRDLLVEQQVLSYQYSYIDDYYYTNDKDAWQYNFGFGKIYDFVSPYILLEYDYVRVFFLYEDKDWMLQMWKGQYGLIFYGGEIGIYNREHSDDGIHEWTFFNCPAEEDWLGMEMTLWHEEPNGDWTREFTREYDKYWWCTGFKNGHLRQEEPADELRMTGRITFKDEEMTNIVAEGLKSCGFGVSQNKDSIGLDQIYVDGKDIYYCWQNINDAESTMFIKFSLGFISSLATLTFIPFFAPIIAIVVGVFGILCILVSFIL